MNRKPHALTLASTLLLAGALALPVAAPAAADQVLTLASHSDAMKMMGKTTPAKDETHTTGSARTACGTTWARSSVITRLDQKKFYIVNHTRRPTRRSTCRSTSRASPGPRWRR